MEFPHNPLLGMFKRRLSASIETIYGKTILVSLTGEFPTVVFNQYYFGHILHDGSIEPDKSGSYYQTREGGLVYYYHNGNLVKKVVPNVFFPRPKGKHRTRRLHELQIKRKHSVID